MQKDLIRKSRFEGANILSDLISNMISPEIAIKNWPSIDDEILDEALHLIYHFKADYKDARKEFCYKKWQDNEIKKIIKLLQE